MRHLAETGNEGLGKGMAAGLRLAAGQLKPAVLAEIPKVMPRQGGYAEALSKSLQFRIAVRDFKHVARVTWRTYGNGQKERRDVPRLNAGVLRHPVYGRTRKLRHHARHRATSMANPWVAQTVTPGFVDRPVDQLGPEVRRQMQVVIDQVAAKIARG